MFSAVWCGPKSQPLIQTLKPLNHRWNFTISVGKNQTQKKSFFFFFFFFFFFLFCFIISFAIFPMFSAVWCGPKSQPLIQTLKPQNHRWNFTISVGKNQTQKKSFFFFFFFFFFKSSFSEVFEGRYFPISFAIFPMFSAVWCGPKSQPLIQTLKPQNHRWNFTISVGENQTQKKSFFLFFILNFILSFLYAIFPMFSAVWCGPKSQPLIQTLKPLNHRWNFTISVGKNQTQKKSLFLVFFLIFNFIISQAIFPMFSAVWCGPKSQPLIQTLKPLNHRWNFTISVGKNQTQKKSFFFFFFFFFFIFILFYHFFCDFSHVFGCMVWA